MDEQVVVKLRESGMPDQAYWETLMDIPLILERLAIGSGLKDVVELGCGYGTFSVPVAERISGTLYSYDIEPDMVNATRCRAEACGLENVVCRERDILSQGYGLSEGLADACLLFNILHCEEAAVIFSKSSALLRPGGRLLAIHWRYDEMTPRGPSMAIRPRPEAIIELAKADPSLEWDHCILDLPPWHYGLSFQKKN
jgi:SAM-dependent methyltransferase